MVNGLSEVEYGEDGEIILPATWAESEEFDPETRLLNYQEYNLIGMPVRVISAEELTPGMSINAFGQGWQVDSNCTGEYAYDALGRKRSDKQVVQYPAASVPA